MTFLRQTTLRRTISCVGIGLHSGRSIRMTMGPAPADSGITFVRGDLGGATVAARYHHVCETTLGTTIADGEVSVATIEHLMAALWGGGVDNALVEIDGPEVPAMDGSSDPFLFLVECAGLCPLDAPRRVIRVLRPVAVADGERHITVEPGPELSVAFEIAFDNPVIGRQKYAFADINGAFKHDIARARTFGLEAEIEHLHRAGLALGGSLENAIVVGPDRVLNDDGLRFGDEFVRHKVLDCIGDLYLAGARLVGRVSASRAGHELNNRLLRAVFADDDNWRYELDSPTMMGEDSVAALA